MPLEGACNRTDICLKKYKALPWRKLINSNKNEPGLICANHKSNFPFPFPIREPTAFLVSGRWGKALNQKNLFVLPDLRTARFKNNLNFDKCFEES
jgi:hypothetical protein